MYLLYDNIDNYTNSQYNNYEKILNKRDKLKLNKFIRDSDKKLFLLSRYLLTKLLKDMYDINYSNQNIFVNKYGKPFIKNVYFNITHSKNYSVVCASKNRIGIDIEKIRRVNLNTINYFCTTGEKEYIMNSVDKYKSLFEIFCLKEAYFKMLGYNLSNIKNIEFVINKDNIICSNDRNIDIFLNNDIDNCVIAIIEEKN